MWNDPVVEETRKLRDEYAALFDYDLRAIYLDLKKKEEQHKEKVVSLESAALFETTPREEDLKPDRTSLL